MQRQSSRAPSNPTGKASASWKPHLILNLSSPLYMAKKCNVQQAVQGDTFILQALRHQHRFLLPSSWTLLEDSLRYKARSTQEGSHILQQHLSPIYYQISDVEEASENRCVLSLRPYGQRFVDQAVNKLLVSLFLTIARPDHKVKLSRFDLFHGHLFRARGWPHSLGILFHAMEYPALSEAFDINLGFCQLDSQLEFNAEAWDTRNWLFSQGILLCLDLAAGSILHRHLLSPLASPMRTVSEETFGQPLCDVFYFPSEESNPSSGLFMCPLIRNEHERANPNCRIL